MVVGETYEKVVDFVKFRFSNTFEIDLLKDNTASVLDNLI